MPGQKTRHIPVNATALAAFKELLPAVDSRHSLNTDHQPLRSARDWFEVAIEKAETKKYTLHCKRHTFASRLVMAGTDMRTVAELMRHSTIQVTDEISPSSAGAHTGRGGWARFFSSNGLVTQSATGKTRRSR